MYNRMCAFREKCGELERVLTAVRKENSDLLDKCAILESEHKTLKKLKFDLEEKLGDLERDVKIFEQKEGIDQFRILFSSSLIDYSVLESELKTLQKQKFDQEKLGDLEREVEIFKEKEKGIHVLVGMS